MTTVIIVVHLMLVLAMIGLVLLQRSEGGALGIGGGGGGGLMTRRGAGNLLTRATGILAAGFFATSIAMTVIARLESRPADILEQLENQQAEGAIPAVPMPGGTPGDNVDAPTVPAPPSGGVLDALRQQSGQQSGESGGPQLPPSGQ